MASICRRGSPYCGLAEMQDILGFQNFVEGRICCLYLHVRQWDIERRKLRKHAPHWCNGLILQLLQITHRQWTYRNQTVHYKARDGLTERQQHKIMRQCEALLWTDPSVLLPEDRQLLDVDFESLGDGPAVDRQLWISEMEPAVAAAHIADGTDANCPTYPPAPLDTAVGGCTNWPMCESVSVKNCRSGETSFVTFRAKKLRNQVRNRKSDRSFARICNLD
jgi:hypothetical protein